MFKTSSIPLLSIPMLAYWLVVARHQGMEPSPDGSIVPDPLEKLLFPPLNLPSGATLELSAGTLFIIASLLLLFFEIVRATRTDMSSIMNHGLSVLVFVAGLVLLLASSSFAHPVFMLITLMAGIDVIAGFTIGIVGARRDFGVRND